MWAEIWFLSYFYLGVKNLKTVPMNTLAVYMGTKLSLLIIWKQIKWGFVSNYSLVVPEVFVLIVFMIFESKSEKIRKIIALSSVQSKNIARKFILETFWIQGKNPFSSSDATKSRCKFANFLPVSFFRVMLLILCLETYRDCEPSFCSIYTL